MRAKESVFLPLYKREQQERNNSRSIERAKWGSSNVELAFLVGFLPS